MRRYLPFLIVALVAVAAFGGGYALYRAKHVPAPTPAKAGTDSGGHVRGKNSAAVTIEEFGDFQCPPCSMMASFLKQTEEDYGSRLRVVFHHYPLAMHANARPAAHAAEAADMQGRFWDMHDLLYKEQPKWSKDPDVAALLVSYATTLGLDVERFKQDMAGEPAKARVDADQKLGASRGVTSTPTLFLNNTLVPASSLNPETLRKLIDEALGEKKEKPKS